MPVLMAHSLLYTPLKLIKCVTLDFIVRLTQIGLEYFQ